MQFSHPPRPRNRENIVPMINVVFLLLIFFLMTAQITPPEPFKIAPPEAEGGEAMAATDTLFVDADGTLAYGDVTGDAVFAALSNREDTPLQIRADAGLSGAALAAMLPRLAAAGVRETVLLTRAK